MDSTLQRLLVTASADLYDLVMPDGPPPILPVLLVGGAVGALSAYALWAYSVYSPRCQFWSPVIRSLPQRDAVSLTFNDAPDAEATPRILDVLAKEKVKGTFFVIGRDAERQPDLVRRIVVEGHSLGAHAYDAAFSVWRPRAYWRLQLNETQRVIKSLTGEPAHLFRPPNGYKTGAVGQAALEAKVPIVGWSVQAPRGRSAAEIERHVVKRTTGHDIVLLQADDVATAEALPAIIAEIREKELQIVPLIEAILEGSKDVERASARTRAQAQG